MARLESVTQLVQRPAHLLAGLLDGGPDIGGLGPLLVCQGASFGIVDISVDPVVVTFRRLSPASRRTSPFPRTVSTVSSGRSPCRGSAARPSRSRLRRSQGPRPRRSARPATDRGRRR